MSRTISTNYLNGLTLTNTADSPVTIGSGITISSAAGNALQSTPAYPWAIYNQGTLLASASDGVALADLRILTNAATGSIDGYTFGVSVGSAGTVVNQGQISQTGTTTPGYQFLSAGAVVQSAGVYIAGGQLDNLGGTITSDDIAVGVGGGSVTNSGSISSAKEFGIFLTAGAQVTNQNGGSVYGGRYGIAGDGQFSVTNETGAAISGADDGIIDIAGIGTVTNLGAISGGDYAVDLQNAAGTVINQGTLTGTAFGAIRLSSGGYAQNQPGGQIDGKFFGVDVGGAPGTVVNQGTIQSTAAYSPYNSFVKGYTAAGGGVVLNDGGSVTNSGTGTIAGGFYGVYINGAPGTVINSGVISSSDNPIYYSFATFGRGAGVALVAGGSLTNSQNGTISGRWVGAQLGLFPRYQGTRTEESLASTFVNQGTIDASSGTAAGAALWLSGPATVINYANAVIQGATNGTISGGPLNGFIAGPFGIVAYYSTTVINRGSIGGTDFSVDAANQTASVGNLIALTPGATFSAEVMGANSSTFANLATLELMSGASAGTIDGIGSKYVNFGNIEIDAGARWTLNGTFASGTTIDGFAQGDTIELAGVTTATGVSPTPMTSSDQLTINGTGLVLQFDNGVTGKTFFETVVNGQTDLTISCFAAGTRIGTVSGPVPVETLRPGMRVMTGRGDQADIVWIGTRTIDCRRHPAPDSVRPVRVAANAFGPGLPSRDLLLSPDHAVFVEGVLIPIRYLIDGKTIRQIAMREVTYYHIELPAHDVILAEDLPVESYLDTGDRSNFSNGGVAVRLFPNFAARMWEMAGCAPLVMTGPVLDRVRRSLSVRRPHGDTTGGFLADRC